MHISSPRKHQSPLMKRYHETFSSSDSSIIPFAESKVGTIAPTREPEWGNSSRNGKRRLEPTLPDITKEDSSARVDGRRTKDFHRRPRHKMRDSHSKQTTGAPKESKKLASIKRKKPKASRLEEKKQEGGGGALINGISADNFAKNRLTLRPSHSFGVFKKGRASTPIKNGLPDLAFSEMNFLGRRSFGLPMDEKTISKCKMYNKSQHGSAENGLSSYFNSSARRVRESKYDVVTTSSDSYTNPRKRHIRDHIHPPGRLSPEVFVTKSPGRLSPRSSMAGNLRRKGIYSLPGNRSSSSGSTGINTSAVEGPSKDVDEHSEYSRAGFQARFKFGPKSPADAYNDSYRGGIARSCTRSHKTEILEQARETCNTGFQGDKEIYPNTTAKPEDGRPATGATVRQVPDSTALTITICKPLARRSTPKPPQLQEIPDSSSPLAALLRVCADSPVRSSAQEEHNRINGKKTRQNTRDPMTVPQISTVCHHPRDNTRPKRTCEPRGYDGVSEPLDTPQFGSTTRFEVDRRGWNNQEQSFDDWRTLPESFYAKDHEDYLYWEQHQEEAMKPEVMEQTTRDHPNYCIDDNYTKDYAGYIDEPILETAYEEYSLGIGVQCPDGTRWRRKYKVPSEYIGDEDNQPESKKDFFIGLPSNYASVMGNLTPEHTKGDWDFGQSYAVINEQQSIVTGKHPIEGYGHNNMNYGAHELQQTHSGLKKENFWRQHKL